MFHFHELSLPHFSLPFSFLKQSIPLETKNIVKFSVILYKTLVYRLVLKKSSLISSKKKKEREQILVEGMISAKDYMNPEHIITTSLA